MTTYMVCDGNGNAITDGLQEHEAERVAQAIADRRHESVWLSQSGDEDMGEQFDPQPPSIEQLADNIRNAKDLWALHDALCAFENALNQDDSTESALNDVGIDICMLPTFGGNVPASTVEVWSWDEDHVLAGVGPFRDWQIEKRR